MHEDDKAGKSRPAASTSTNKGGLSRRQVIQGASALGVTTALAGSMLGAVPARAAGYDRR
jgi:hypothetical protein